MAKVCQGSNAISCANSVLRAFMRHPGSLNPESIVNVRNEIQIVDTHEVSGIRINVEAATDRDQNRLAPADFSDLIKSATG